MKKLVKFLGVWIVLGAISAGVVALYYFLVSGIAPLDLTPKLYLHGSVWPMIIFLSMMWWDKFSDK